MSDAATPPVDAFQLAGLIPALLDFEQMPGRYRVALREPGALFDQIHAVLLLAAGRPVEGLTPPTPGEHAQAVQQAARYFVRVVMLRPGADHYSLLGLTPDAEPTTLRDHYRLMIRLTHPDFAASGEAWPADAASRINLANDVLGSWAKRREYDATLESTRVVPAPGAPKTHKAPMADAGGAMAKGSAVAKRRAAASRAPAPSSHAGGEGWSRPVKIALAAAGALACVLALWLMTPSGHEGSLVAQGKRKAARSTEQVPTPADVALLANLDAQAAAQVASAAAVPVPAPAPATRKARPAVVAEPAVAEPVGSKLVVAEPVPVIPQAVASQSVAALVPATSPPIAPPTAPPSTPFSMPEPARRAAVPKVQAMPALTALNPAPPATRMLATNGTTATPATASVDERDTSRLALHMDKQGSGKLAATPAVAPTVATAAPEPAPAPTPTPTPTPPATGETTLTMTQVQPVLGRVLAGLQTGKGENVIQILEGHWRDHPASTNFVNKYQQLLAGQQLARLGKVSFSSRTAAEHLVVDGVIELHLQDAKAAEQVKSLHMSAYFLEKNGQPALTQVVAHRLR